MWREKSRKVLEYWRLLGANVAIQYQTFLQHSGVAGHRFLRRSEDRRIRRTWHLIIGSFAVTTLIIIINLWDKFQRKPIINVINLDRPSKKMEFPSVFICPEEIYDSELLHQVAVKIVATHAVGVKAEELAKCITSLQLMGRPNHRHPEYCRRRWMRMIDQHDVAFQIFRTLHTIDSMFKDCFLKGQHVACSMYFAPNFSEQGVCYVSNNAIIARTYSQRKSHFFANFKVGQLYQYDPDWSFKLNMRQMEGKTLIFVKDPQSLVTLKDRASVEWDHWSGIYVKFMNLEQFCPDSLRSLSVSQRDCYFPDESPDVHLRHYSRDSCIYLCHMRDFYRRCGCVFRNHFLLFPSLHYPWCKLSDQFCYYENYKAVSQNDCPECLKNCNYTEYIIEQDSLEQYVNNIQSEKEQMTFTSEAKIYDNHSYHPIVFDLKYWPQFNYRATVVFGWMELLVSFGGIAGLFMGISLMTFVELLYFASLRLVCAFRRDQPALRRSVAERKEGVVPKINLQLKPLNR